MAKRYRVTSKEKVVDKRKKTEHEPESTTTLPCIPEELIIDDILTRLPPKPLFRFKAVSKKWNHIITSDSNFAIKQSSNNHDACSKGIVFVHGGKKKILMFLSLLDHHGEIGIPDPTFDFLHLSLNVRTVIASTNGLLCVSLERTRGVLYVCNPMIKKSHRICYNDRGSDSVGLVFDPATSSPHHYKIVQPIRSPINSETNLPLVDAVEYGFEVFSSCSGEWIKSSQKVILPMGWGHYKSVYTKGVVYWHCYEYLLWFDCEKDLAGQMQLPHQGFGVHPEIGVTEDRLTCTQVTRQGLEVWELVRNVLAYRRGDTDYDDKWVLRHLISLDKMVEDEILVRMAKSRMRRRSGEVEEFESYSLVKELFMHPLPFDGGEKVHLRVALRPKINCERDSEKLKMMVCFDLKTGVSTRCSYAGLFGRDKVVFGYVNNLAPLPKLV